MKKSIKLLSVVLLALMMVFTSSLRVMAADVTVTYSIVNRSIDGVENKKPLVTTELVVSGETPKNVPTELPTAPEGYYSTGWRYKTATMPEALPVEGEITDFVVNENITFSYGVWQNDYTQIEADFSVRCNLEWHVAAVSDTESQPESQDISIRALRQKGKLYLSIVDGLFQGLPNIKVKLTGRESSISTEYVTDESGLIYTDQLETDVYDIDILEHSGYNVLIEDLPTVLIYAGEVFM